MIPLLCLPASLILCALSGFSNSIQEEMRLQSEVFSGLLTAFVVAISIYDIRERRIPNLIVFPAAFIGLTLNMALRGWEGLGFGLKGLATGFALLFIAYLVGGMKAGDV